MENYKAEKQKSFFNGLFNCFRSNETNTPSVSKRKLSALVTLILLLAIIAFLIVLSPNLLKVYAQLGLIILFQILLHELAHYSVALKFYNDNVVEEMKRLHGPPTETESDFLYKYIAPRFGFNAFNGIKSLKFVPAIFIQELNYTGSQFALITLAGPVVDFSLAAIYIIIGILLGPMDLLGFFNTQILIYYGTLTILIWPVAYFAKKLDFGQYRYSSVKRNASNRFLMGAWYLDEAVLDEMGQLTLNNQPGKSMSITRLHYLFEKIKANSISKTELELLIEAVIAANPPLARLARTGTLLQKLYSSEVFNESKMAELETEIGNVEKAFNAHKIVVQMDEPVYIGLDLIPIDNGVNTSRLDVQYLLGQLKENLGISHKVPYMLAGGKLFCFIEKKHIKQERISALLLHHKFDNLIQVREVHENRQSFKGRKTIQVGIAKMHASESADFSRELAHAEVLWDMVRTHNNAFPK